MRLVIPGNPVAQGRPRVTKFGTYDPPKSKEYKQYVKRCVMNEKPGEPTKQPLAARIDAYMSIPKSKPRKWREDAGMGMIRPTKRPDLSNIVKCIEDALTGVVWHDDSQIVRLIAIKRYSDYPRVEVTIQEDKV